MCKSSNSALPNTAVLAKFVACVLLDPARGQGLRPLRCCTCAVAPGCSLCSLCSTIAGATAHEAYRRARERYVFKCWPPKGHCATKYASGMRWDCTLGLSFVFVSPERSMRTSDKDKKRNRVRAPWKSL